MNDLMLIANGDKPRCCTFMTENRILDIRKFIANAQEQEAQEHALKTYLDAKVPFLHHSIIVPEKQASSTLFEFVTSYIEHAPAVIEALTDMTKNAGIYEYAKTFLTIAEDYFLTPPELIDKFSGLHALLGEAYLAHRLVEELNDRITMIAGVPLAPVDMGVSNVIVHDLLGEEFANHLDLAVHYAIESLFKTEDIFNNSNFTDYIAHCKKYGWDETLRCWPCLTGDPSIFLKLNNEIEMRDLN